MTALIRFLLTIIYSVFRLFFIPYTSIKRGAGVMIYVQRILLVFLILISAAVGAHAEKSSTDSSLQKTILDSADHYNHMALKSLGPRSDVVMDIDIQSGAAVFNVVKIMSQDDDKPQLIATCHSQAIKNVVPLLLANAPICLYHAVKDDPNYSCDALERGGIVNIYTKDVDGKITDYINLGGDIVTHIDGYSVNPHVNVAGECAPNINFCDLGISKKLDDFLVVLKDYKLQLSPNLKDLVCDVPNLTERIESPPGACIGTTSGATTFRPNVSKEKCADFCFNDKLFMKGTCKWINADSQPEIIK